MNAAESDVSPVVPASQELVVNLIGLHVHGLGRGRAETAEPLPASVFLTVLGQLGVPDTTTRSTLNRMVTRGGLVRHRRGRTSAFGASETLLGMLRSGRERLFSPAPFEPVGETWTILNCPIPESLRTTRYHLQARLVWAGFGMIQPNFWIGPGRIDVEQLIEDIPHAHDFVRAFHGTPALPSLLTSLVESGWDLAGIRAAHEAFAQRWEHAEPSSSDALPHTVQLLTDWGKLLRTDPGLPIGQDDKGWPAERSTRIFRDLERRIGAQAELSLSRLTVAD
ncbi:PaaX family transcriptional regulator [Streptomyces justiciae]|uniref:PaaX family transcriptional regulator n=1 Tax=Streptomyces justiciae TaxID=2780140 RepID=UPI00211789CE|nr:PaaX family transcriptional regulator C-terminal domain-containing protein [Streptomyces justiciae]MCW8378693.1 hypothetical protein [Streptomyces justiciae]